MPREHRGNRGRLRLSPGRGSAARTMLSHPGTLKSQRLAADPLLGRADAELAGRGTDSPHPGRHKCKWTASYLLTRGLPLEDTSGICPAGKRSVKRGTLIYIKESSAIDGYQ